MTFRQFNTKKEWDAKNEKVRNDLSPYQYGKKQIWKSCMFPFCKSKGIYIQQPSGCQRLRGEMEWLEHQNLYGGETVSMAIERLIECAR